MIALVLLALLACCGGGGTCRHVANGGEQPQTQCKVNR